ncbi:cation diffusion facilitator family transporter [Campylobacter sp. VicNov18]|uniref:cation diffusion facilitator family transporter n=1 Tax=Campylobacter bilis TaxID=2691918 RepID=UPI00130E4B1C|nr:cation diffusion facilitator family transporter [Campylobacter bilis]MPV63875.1 cation diffusion facilitator family transporter [Campylobacter hepaticus]MBM0637376.1 cation diffusion facilitator family transporter [Campylobacter bilis]MCC8278097.1 cation diffusion facilitator family transporter [Campylobacter bilis]MCC8299601.1 cation diffusion facilitator family transporter [Campylobacter bilis]MCC8301006.1 cation diffusion facilitator family transporter [Campylobacter bilis]
MSLQKKATLIASLCAIVLALIKFMVGLASGSVAVLSSAIDSLMDFAISAFNFLALKKSSQKANENYNFGFSKIEALMGLLEGVFIVGVGVFIFYESILKIYNKEEIKDLNLSIYVMIFALLVTFFLVLFLNHVAKKTQSLIIQSDALHYKTDCLSNACTLGSLILIYFTNLHIIDAIFGIVISLYTAFSAFKIIKKALAFLMDQALSKDQVDRICALIASNHEVISYHDLKTRKTPNCNYLSVHLVFCPIISLLNAHKISDDIENGIRKMFHDEKWEIQIHLDPYDDEEQERQRQ